MPWISLRLPNSHFCPLLLYFFKFFLPLYIFFVHCCFKYTWCFPWFFFDSKSYDGKESLTNLERCRRIISHSYFSCTCFSTHIHMSFELSFSEIYSIKSHLEGWMEDTCLLKTLNHDFFYIIWTFYFSIILYEITMLGCVIFKFPYNHFVKLIWIKGALC